MLGSGGVAGASAGGSGGGAASPLISRAILIDREVDIVTPMMTQVSHDRDDSMGWDCNAGDWDKGWIMHC